MDTDFEALATRLVSKNVDKIQKRHIDIISGGGGFATMYTVGVIYYLKALQKLNLIGIDQFSGASSGNFTAKYFYIDPKFYSHIHTEICDAQAQGKYCTDFLYTILGKYLPDNVHTLVDGKMHIRTHTVSLWNFPYFLKSTDYSTFTSKSDLLHTVMCSCTIPKLSHSSFTKYHKGEYHIDGLAPRTDFGVNSDKLYINLFNVTSFAKSRLIIGTKGEVESLIIRGMYDAHLLFVEGKETPCLYWYKPYKYKDIFTPMIEHAKIIYNCMLIVLFYVCYRRYCKHISFKYIRHKYGPIFRYLISMCQSVVKHF
jgi:hypothetical protein